MVKTGKAPKRKSKYVSGNDASVSQLMRSLNYKKKLRGMMSAKNYK